MATKKTSEKTTAAASAKKRAVTSEKKTVAARRTGAVKQDRVPKPLPHEPPNKPNGPTAKVCPLVLDGEVEALDFSPKDCCACSEFDCRFCRAEERSGTLRSRLFAVDDAGGGGDDEFGGDFDFGGDDGEEEEEEGDEEEIP